MRIADIYAWVEENVMTFPEAALYMHMTRAGIHNAVNGGRLRAIKGSFILKTDLDEYNKVIVSRRPRSK
jgi:hypothetical protein